MSADLPVDEAVTAAEERLRLVREAVEAGRAPGHAIHTAEYALVMLRRRQGGQ